MHRERDRANSDVGSAAVSVFLVGLLFLGFIFVPNISAFRDNPQIQVFFLFGFLGLVFYWAVFVGIVYTCWRAYG